MDYSKIIADESFFEWHGYAPMDAQYVRYADSDPSIVAAGHKIEDVFYAFANARASFIDADSEDFGDISGPDDLSRLYAKTHFLTYALMEYSICLDISWQVIWAFIQPSSFDYLVHQKYKEMEKECTSENVHLQLNCAISQGGLGVVIAEKIRHLLTDFENDEDVLNLRSLYNSIKHHGMIHFEGLGAKNDTMFVSLNGRSTPVLSRKSYKIEDLEELLYSYHFKFESFFNSLIAEIMPEDYKETKVQFIDYLNTLLKMNHSLDKK